MKASEQDFTHDVIQTPFPLVNDFDARKILMNRFRAIRRRCTDPENNRFHLYGARGIQCEWATYNDFAADMWEPFKEHIRLHGVKNTQIDRADPDKNYCKENCRWVSRIEQARNRRNIKPITYKGRTQILSDWTNELGLEFSRTYQRIYIYKWPLQEVFDPKKRINQYG